MDSSPADSDSTTTSCRVVPAARHMGMALRLSPAETYNRDKNRHRNLDKDFMFYSLKLRRKMLASPLTSDITPLV